MNEEGKNEEEEDLQSVSLADAGVYLSLSGRLPESQSDR